MKKIILVISAIVGLPLFGVFAQGTSGVVQRTAKQVVETNAVAEPDGMDAPELDIKEYQTQCSALKGKVIKLSFNKVSSFKPDGSGCATATVCNNRSNPDWINLTIPAAGMEFFGKLFSENEDDDQSIYVQVVSPFTARALGFYYDAVSPVGKRYSWE